MEQIRAMWYDFVSPQKLLKWIGIGGKTCLNSVMLNDRTIATSKIL